MMIWKQHAVSHKSGLSWVKWALVCIQLAVITDRSATVVAEQIGAKNLVIGGGDPDGPGPAPCVGVGCPEYTNGPPGGPLDCGDPLCLTFTVNGGGIPSPTDPCDEGPCNALPPQIRAELVDCRGEVIETETRRLDGPSCESGSGENPPQEDISEEFTFGVCGRVPTAIRVVGINSYARPNYNEPETCQIAWQESGAGPTTLEVPPPPLNGTLTKAELDCLSCEPKPQASHGRVVLHKSTVKNGRARLYTLQDEWSEATFGETVNGEFRVPSAGQLVIELSVSTNAVDVWGGGRFNGYTRSGSQIVDHKTVWWTQTPSPGTKYDFSIRTYRGYTPQFRVSFHWYRWDEDDTCCIQHEVETLDIEALPLTCEPTGRDPAVPHLRLPASDGHVELRVPCCPHCSEDKACVPGDTSEWFVTFPANPVTKPIIDGHAKGWRLDGSTLWNPGPDRLGYEFGPGQ